MLTTDALISRYDQLSRRRANLTLALAVHTGRVAVQLRHTYVRIATEHAACRLALMARQSF